MADTGSILAGYLILNAIAFFLYVDDKRRAARKQWRIREKTLLLAALAGPFGAYLAMKIVRHKTQKRAFGWVPVYVGLHMVVLVAFILLSW
jgi:uncharacterized membrane protein YsdA (DUF1294 family)